MTTRIGYADPPYPGQSEKHYAGHPDYAGEVNHRELVQRLDKEYDGWVLHTASTTLDHVLGIVTDLGIDCRIMAWVKPFAAFKRNVSVAYAWEPVLVKAARKPVVRHRVVMRDWLREPHEDIDPKALAATAVALAAGTLLSAQTEHGLGVCRAQLVAAYEEWANTDPPLVDWLAESITLKRGLTGAKPEKVCRWLFEMLGAEPGDEFHDLYPGSGAVLRAWGTWRDEIINAQIVEAAS